MNPVSGYNPDQPWERQPFDTDLSWAWFQEFLFLPVPRALVKLARRDGCPWTWTQLETLAYSDAWKERAEAWDRHLATSRRKQVEAEIQETARDVATRHAKGWAKAFRLGIRELAKLEGLSEKTGDLPTLTPRELVRLLDVATRSERLILGEATERIESGPDLSRLTDAELEQLRDLEAKLAS